MAGTDWMLDASCMDHPVLDWFDDEHYQSAARVCDACPVRSPCLDYAVTHQIDDGVWGGLVPFQLRKLITARKKGGGRGVPRDDTPRAGAQGTGGRGHG
jgi:hypothetical protein